MHMFEHLLNAVQRWICSAGLCLICSLTVMDRCFETNCEGLVLKIGNSTHQSVAYHLIILIKKAHLSGKTP